MGILLFGSVLEETPEGVFRMDRLRMAESAWRTDISKYITSDELARLDAEVDQFVLGVSRGLA